MGWIALLLLAGVVAVGYYGYRRLRQLEQDIRREISAGEPEPEPEPELLCGHGQELAERVLERVQEKPGLLQTELYEFFPKERRRVLQDLLRGMEQEGVLTRTKEGGTYRLRLPSSR